MYDDLACVRWNNGEVQCWGDESEGLDWEGLRLQGELEVARGVVCGLQTNGVPTCKTNIFDFGNLDTTNYVSIKPGDSSLCALNLARGVECPFVSPFVLPSFENLPEGPFNALEVADGDYVCGLTDRDEWRCDGDIDFHRLPPENQFVKLSLGRGLHCGLEQEGTIRCWGTVLMGPIPRPEGTFIDLDMAAGFEGCGVNAEGGLDCWGRFAPDTSQAEGVVFRKVTVAIATACGIVGSDKVFCFGRRISQPPDDIAYVP